jgi:polar amino acid transport system permease protein
MDLSFYTQEVAPALLRGLWVSLGLILPSAVFGLAAGVLAGTLRVYGRPFWKRMAEFYGLLFRGFPLLVQLYLWYFGLPQLGIYLSPYAAAVIGFSLCSGAYHA